ncbi:DNA/RNA helicase domain-containing protein [Virgibacillus xinjiangensis]|uniref:DNA/RNA helicase domain-containing protein n=1 Tax=Virgibacillus xinjiangensis TaxID=393090 RepID=A0ABV7CVT5_9BACI
MIVYNEKSSDFIDHIYENKIGYVLKENVYKKMNKVVSEGEFRSWENSLPEMAKVVRDSDIEKDTHILLEYKLPSTEKRIDFIIAGRDKKGKKNAMIIELKQWQKADMAEGSGIVRTFLGGRERETVHPSYQATSYKRFLMNFNESLYTDLSIQLNSCAYLHNYIANRSNEPLLNPKYNEFIGDSPIYFQFGDRELAKKINHLVSEGNGAEIAEAIEHGRIRPSKKLVETVGSLIEGNEEFVLLDEQKVAYEKVRSIYNQAQTKTDQKQVIIIKGGPGTGKSVIGLNLISAFLKSDAYVEYITPNQAFREILRKKVVGNSNHMEVRNLFKGSASYVDTPEEYFEVLICDEAHRLKEQGHMKKKIPGENQATQIIRSSKVSVFFVDDQQVISKKDIGTVKLIEEEAEKQGAEIHTVELESQYRCSGSGNYIQWLDSLLGFSDEHVELEGDFDFNIVPDPHQLIEEIVDKRNGRLLAGYAWQWNKKPVNGELPKDVVIEEHDFELPWNDPNRIDWAIHPDCANQVGCIHTVQGLEMDYVGVIIGKDLGYDPETDSLVVRRDEFRDRGARPAKPKKGQSDPLYDLVRNTYRTLMTRGMKGCYVYCCDEDLAAYIKKRMEN